MNKLKLQKACLSAAIVAISTLVATESKAESLQNNLECRPAKLNTGINIPIPALQFCRETTLFKSASQPITAQQVLDFSLQNSAAIKSQQELVQSAIYSLKSANGNWWPNVSMTNSSYLFVNTSGNNNPIVSGCTNNPSTAGKAFNPFNGSTSSCSAASSYSQAYPVITITWNFLNPSRYPQIAGAMKGVKLAESQARQSTQQLELSLLKSYGTYLLAGYQLGELNRLATIENEILSTTNLLVDQRAIPRHAKNLEGRNLLSYQSRIQTAIGTQNQAYLELSTAMEKASSQSGSIAPDLNSLVIREWQYDEEQTMQMAFKNNENLKQLELQKGIATDSANQTRGAILPTVGFLGYVTYQGTDASGEHSGILSNYAGLQLTWNLFDGYITKNQAISSDRQAASYAAQLEEAKTQLRLQVKGKLLSLRTIKKQIDIALNDINHTEVIAEDLKSRERFGLTTRSQVLQAEQQSHESKLQLISSITSYIVTYTELSNLCGVSPLS